MANESFGYTEGEVCNRDGCDGQIVVRPPDNCYCHIVAPCSACTAPRSYCPVCDWDESTE